MTKYLQLLEIKGVDSIINPQILISIPSSNEIIYFTLGESKEISSTAIQIHIKQAEETLGFIDVDLSEEPSQWISLGESISLRFAVTPSKPSKNTPHIFGLAPTRPATCVYLKKLQEIEEKEKEISHLMLESKHKIPDNYRDILDSSPRTSPNRSVLKKKTLEAENFPEFAPDFILESYFSINLENVSSNEPVLLQHAAIGLLNKVRALKLDVEDYQLCQESLFECEASMQILADSVKESKEQLLVEEVKANLHMNSILAETESIEAEITATEKSNNSLSSEIQKIIKEAEEVSVTSSMRGDLSKTLLEIQSLEQYYSSLVSAFSKTFPEQELSAEIDEKTISRSGLQRITNTRDLAMQEGIQLQAELVAVEAEINISSELAVQCEDYRSETCSYARNTKHIGMQFSEILEEKDGNIRNSEKEMEECRESLGPLGSLLEAHETKVLEKQETCLKFSEEVEEILKNNSQLQVVLDREKQIIAEFEDFKQKFLNSNLIQCSVFDEVEYLSNSILQLSESSLTVGRLLRKADDMIEEQELQQMSMRKLIALIKETKPAHIAVQNDPTDMALAKYLNARHKTLDVNFRRTEKEKYCFGSMKVEVKNEEEIFVVTDGKKFKIEEFLEMYNDIEKEKTFKRLNSKIQETTIEQKAKIKIGKIDSIPLGQILKKAK